MTNILTKRDSDFSDRDFSGGFRGGATSVTSHPTKMIEKRTVPFKRGENFSRRAFSNLIKSDENLIKIYDVPLDFFFFLCVKGILYYELS